MTYADAYIYGYDHGSADPYDSPFPAPELARGYQDGVWDAKFRAPCKIREPRKYRQWKAAGDAEIAAARYAMGDGR